MGDSETRMWTSGAYWHRNTQRLQRFVLSPDLAGKHRYHHRSSAGDVVRQRYEHKEAKRRGRCLRRAEGSRSCRAGGFGSGSSRMAWGISGTRPPSEATEERDVLEQAIEIVERRALEVNREIGGMAEAARERRASG